MATLVTVRDVYTPLLTTFMASTPSRSAWAEWQEMCSDRVPSSPLDYVCLVAESGTPIGWLDFSDLVYDPNWDAPVSEVMQKIKADRLLSADTSLLEAAELFSPQSPFGYLVLERSQIVGFFSYYDLLSIPFRACLFSLFCLIEDLIGEILTTNASLALSKLSKDVREQLIRRWKKTKLRAHRPLPADDDLVQVSFFSQKVQMLQSCKRTSRAIPALNELRIKISRKAFSSPQGTRYEEVKTPIRRIDQLKDLRNALAHSASSSIQLPILLPKDDLRDFMLWIRNLESQLLEYSGIHQTLKD